MRPGLPSPEGPERQTGRAEEIRGKMLQAVREYNIDQIKKLLENGADVNAADKDGWTLLHIISINDRLAAGQPEAGKYSIDLVRLLLELGADIQARTECGNTPLHYACTHGMVDVTRLLLESGADPEAENHFGVTPLDLAINCRPVSDREPLLTVFQQFAPGLYFSAFCTAGPGGGP